MLHRLKTGLMLLPIMLGMSTSLWAATYSFDDTATYSWETASTDVVWEGTNTSYAGDDDQQQVSIGFTFNFGGVDYTQVRIMTNGALHFGSDQGFHKDYSNEAFPITTDVNGPGFEEPADRVIAPYWDDLDPSSGGMVRYSTLGSSPNRRFVVSWESVPRYNGGGNYTFQVILYENGEFKFQYGSGNARGNSATIGVEVDNSDYTQYSYNTNAVSNGVAILFSQAYHFAISHDGSGDLCNVENITIEHHDGSHNVDTSGYTGTINLSTSTGNGTWSLVTGNGTFSDLGGGTASYTFAATDSGQVVLGLADSIAETLNINVTDGSDSEDASEDADISFLASGASGTFRDEFDPRAFSNNHGSLTWSGNWIEVDGAGSGATSGNVQISGTRELELDDRPNTGGEPSLAREANLSGYTSATLTFDWSTSNGVDWSDSVIAEVSADGGSNWTTLENFTSISGSSSGSRSFDISTYMASNTQVRFRVNNAYGGNNETFSVDNVQIEVTSASSCPSTDHFVLSHDGLGINCLAEPVTVTAIKSDGTTDTTYTGSITLDTQSGTGSWSLGSGNGVFSDATAGDGLASYQFDSADNGVATFNLDYQSGAVGIDVDAYEGTLRDDDTEGNLVFTPNGFVVTASALSNPPPASIDTVIPTQTAATAFNLYLAAYGQTPTDPTCGIIEAYDGAKNLAFWFSYDDPSSGTRFLTVNGSSAATSEGASSTQSITFNSGQAAVSVNYADVGQLSLSMKDDTVTVDLPTGIRGASDAFVEKPAGFVLSNIVRTSDSFANPAAASASGTAFVTAGGAFTVTVTAVDSAGNATPNYGQESTAEGVLLTPAIVSAGGTHNPAVGFTTGFGTFSNGVATGTDFYWDDVGIITLTPSVADGDYLGAGDVTGTTTGNVGRFYPSDLTTAVSNGSFANTCSAATPFTYLGEGFGYSGNPTVTVTAMSATGNTAQNYSGSYAKLSTGGVSLAYPTADNSQLDEGGVNPINVTSSVGSLGRADNGDGTLTFTLGGAGADLFAYERSAGMVNPFTADLSIQLTAVSDGEASASDLGSAKAITPAGNLQRFGRGTALDVTTPYATIGQTQIIPVTLQYYSAGAWVDNSDDSCTTFTYTQADNGITTSITPTTPVTAAGGAGDLTVQLDADAGDTGGRTTVSFGWDDWLLYDLDGVDQLSDGNLYDDTFSATATFGAFRGDDRFLYWRE